MKRYLIFSLCCLWVSFSEAQNNLSSQTLSNSIFSQRFQPANLAQMDDSLKLQIGVQGMGFLLTNAFSPSVLIREGNYISNTTKEEALSKMPEHASMVLGYEGGINVNFKANQRKWTVFGNYRNGFTANANKDLVGLLLRGNAHYAGKEVKGDEAGFGNMNSIEIGVGTAGKFKDYFWGARIKAIGVLNYNAIEAKTLSFFTSEFGDSISLKSNYDYFRKNQNGLQGGGVGADVGVMIPKLFHPKIEGYFSITDLGLVAVKGVEYQNKIDIKYKGFELKDLLKLDSLNQNNALIDSAYKLIIPDSAIKTRILLTNPTFHLAGLYHLTAQDKISASLHFYTFGNSPLGGSPVMLNIAYRHHFKKIFTLGVNGYAAQKPIGLGFFALADFKLKNRNRLSVFYEMNNILGLVGGGGIHAATGIAWGM